jgi:hypothetical protein
MARSWSVPDYPFVTVPHPVANLAERELDRLAADVVPGVVRILLQQPE